MSAADRPTRTFVLLLALFMALGAAAGAWQVVLADLARALALSPGPLGLALMTSGIASIPTMVWGGRVVDRGGVRFAVAGGAALISLAFVGHVAATGFWALVAAAAVAEHGGGLYDVGINAGAARFEAATRRKAMAWLHAGFSAGAVVGALGAGAFLAAGLPFRAVYAVVWVAMGALALVATFSHTLEEPPPPLDDVGDRLAAARSLYLPGPVLVLGLMTFAGYYGESSMEAWSAIYLRDTLGVTALVGASGVAVFHTAMTAGRVGAGFALRFVGRRTWLVTAGILGAAGTAMAVGTPQPAVAIGGLLLVGCGLSAVAPLAFSLAAEYAPRRVGEATAVITTVGYSGALLAPGLIGAVAEQAGLRLALATVAAGALGLAFMASLLPREGHPSAPPGGT